MIGKKTSTKSIVKAWHRYEKHSVAEKRKIKPFLSQKMAQKKYSSISQSSEAKTKHKIGLGKPRTIALSRI